MRRITDNSVRILGYLRKASLKGRTLVAVGEVRKSVRLPDNEFDVAIQYLLQSHFVRGTLGGDDGSLWLTSEGITFLEHAEESASFWKRNKDKILVEVITALVSYVLGYLSALLVR